MTTAPAMQPTTSPTPGQALPTVGDQPNPMYDKLLYGKTLSDWAIRIVLVAVMTAALAVGTWSIYTLLTVTFHVPQLIALLGCGMFDGAALFFALLSQRYATTTDSGIAPRAAMLLMVGASSWVNWKHAQLEVWGTVGGVILAAAPGIAELTFLMFHKFAHRETLRNLGRVPQALPALGKWAWLTHPQRARKTVDAYIKADLTEHEAVAERREYLAADRARHIIEAQHGRPATDSAYAVAQVPRGATAPAATPQLPRSATPSGRYATPALPAAATTATVTATLPATDESATPVADRSATDRSATPQGATAKRGVARSATTPSATRSATASAAPATTASATADEATDGDGGTYEPGTAKHIVHTLWLTTGKQPLGSEIVAALGGAGLPNSEQQARKIRAQVRNENTNLPGVRAA